MPVVVITGPSGLTQNAKKELIEGTLRVMSDLTYLLDDRVYIHEVPIEERRSHASARGHAR
jgi:phenylpyruvate tautomerase PptA (4-oxalocrotonate tautomerase family)